MKIIKPIKLTLFWVYGLDNSISLYLDISLILLLLIQIFPEAKICQIVYICINCLIKTRNEKEFFLKSLLLQ